MLEVGTLNCKVSPEQQSPPTPLPWPTHSLQAAHMYHMVCADAGLVRQDLPRAPWPQAILKVRHPNSLDYRARYDTPASYINVF